MAGLGERLSNALSEAVHAAEDEMVIKWVCQVETVDAGGHRGMWTLSSDGATPWDKIGMLGFGLQRQHAEMTADRINDGS